jgi:NAD(P)-dependent dehydrogenase (short-subunit alcohol dehydrogenase family)
MTEIAGICLSYVQIAYSLGAKIIIGDVKLTPEAEAFVSKADSDRIVFQPCDVTKWDQLKRLVFTSEEKYGDVPDVWIAGAGVFEPVRLQINFFFRILCCTKLISHWWPKYKS